MRVVVKERERGRESRDERGNGKRKRGEENVANGKRRACDASGLHSAPIFTGLLLKVLPRKAADRSLRKAESLPFRC